MEAHFAKKHLSYYEYAFFFFANLIFIKHENFYDLK